MRRVSTLLSLLGLLALASVLSAQQSGALKAAADALGVANIKTLQFTGSGTNFSVGQNFSPSEAWPPVSVKTYTASINYDTGSMRQELLRDLSVPQPRGGGAAFTGGEQRQIQVVSGDYAWNVAAAAPTPAGGTPAAPPPPAAAPGNQLDRMLMLWATPHGFVKAATANKATTKQVAGGTEVSFTIGGKYKMVGIINAKNQVERVQTWIDHPLIGDMLVETEYSGYYDFGGVLFPTHILQKQDGLPSLDLAIASVTPNPAVDITVPDNVRTASPAPVTVTAQKLAEGVHYLTGGGAHSLAVAMSDHIVLVDTPTSEERALAVIAKAKELIPNKPIRFVVNSHHHWDHSGGIRAAMDEGATIVTHESNKGFFERVAKSPHTIIPDRMAKSQKPVKIQTVGAKGTLTDGTRTIELYTLPNYRHTGDMLIVYLPKEKILAEADAFSAPATPTTPLNPVAVPGARLLYDTITQLKLDVQTIAPFHGGRTSDVAELGRLSGRSPTP